MADEYTGIKLLKITFKGVCGLAVHFWKLFKVTAARYPATESSGPSERSWNTVLRAIVPFERRWNSVVAGSE